MLKITRWTSININTTEKNVQFQKKLDFKKTYLPEKIDLKGLF